MFSQESNKARFAVVGHPNKGKSSIVSTLSQDDSIKISSLSGTTTESSAYEVDETIEHYQLIDTPGFQRPHKVLEWLKQHAQSAEQRSKAVIEFINDEECLLKFPDEVKLLTPIVEGAAILYVVDGSRPYGSDYEAEMEILRWTGSPSMALINPIESEDQVESWKDALEQYFKLVRVFNPMTAEFDKQLELLEAFTYLKPEWKHHLKSIISHLKESRERQKEQSANILTRLVDDLCFYQIRQKVLTQHQAELIHGTVEKQYQNWMIKREQRAYKELLKNYRHNHTQFTIDELALPPDLFDCDQWFMWGLNKKQLTATSALTGAVVGATADAAVGGASLMLGAVIGSAVGFTSAWFASDQLLKVDIKGLPLGGYEAVYGPIKNKNFPYVVGT